METRITLLKRILFTVLTIGFVMFFIPECYATGDFNGDGKDDIITFVRTPRTGYSDPGFVYVALSTGSSFSGKGLLWHNWFCVNNEIPAIGDFDGDGKDDIVTFTRNVYSGDGIGDVWVALSTGNNFYKAGGGVWNDWFCINDEIPLVGNFNDDDYDDIVTFVRSTQTGDYRGDVFVALSNGQSFVNAGKWHEFFCINNEIPAVGDFDGDGKDDIVTFARNVYTGTGIGDVYVALSTGSSFEGKGVKWHDFFCINNEIPAVGDVNGDGKDDIITFVRNTQEEPEYGDVYVALSTGHSFEGKKLKWHDWFCVSNEIPTVGKFNNDNKDDIATFVHESKFGDVRANVYTAFSTGSTFSGTGNKWHDFFCIYDEVPTTYSAVFPYFMFAKSYEPHHKNFNVYALNDHWSFPYEAYEFKDEFDSEWPCSQYYWSECRFLGVEHMNFADKASITYITGHGDVAEIQVSGGGWCNLRNCSWGSWSSHSRRGDLDYIFVHSCQSLSLGTHWRNRWGCTPQRMRPFAGLHVACGFRSNFTFTTAWDLGDEVAQNLEDGFSVRWAWHEAVDDHNDWVSPNNISCVMFVRPYRYDDIYDYKRYDRWYHDNDYILDATYLTYD